MSRHALLFRLLLDFLAFLIIPIQTHAAVAVQTPFLWNGGHEAAATKPNGAVASDWNLDALPNVNETGHLVFDTVNSFLQHWPNTRYRNGMQLSLYASELDFVSSDTIWVRPQHCTWYGTPRNALVSR
jgi:hypothetical protein